MITPDTEEIKNGNLTVGQDKAIRKMIDIASDEGTASGGQRVAFRFLRSLSGEDSIDMRDVLYHFEVEDICNIIRACESNDISSFYKKI